MKMHDFANHVMPTNGNRVLLLIKKDGAPPQHKHYATTADMIGAAQAYDTMYYAVYFGVNGFGDPYYDEKTEKHRIRTQENVVSCRSLFDDFDVDATKKKAYDTKEEAREGLLTLFKALKLSPTIVDSGGGYHTYITMDKDFGPDEWTRLSTLKRAVCRHLGVKSDDAVNKDSSRVLRLIGCTNKKHGSKPVRLIKKGKVYPLAKVAKVLEDYVMTHQLTVEEPRVREEELKVANPFAGALEDYPPSFAEEIANRCGVIKSFRDGKDADGHLLEEPIWHRAIGVIKFCEDGEIKIHEWSAKDDRYDEAQTQDYISKWAMGPTLCEEFNGLAECMGSCQYAGKCKSPIQLGYTEDSPEPKEATEEQVEEKKRKIASSSFKTITIGGRSIPYWPTKGYQATVEGVAKAERDKDGNIEWVPFSKLFVFPINRMRSTEGEWSFRLAALEKDGRTWREFNMPTDALADHRAMAKILAAHEVFTQGGPKGRQRMADFFQDVIHSLMRFRHETKTVKQFGWSDDQTEFTIGTTALGAKDEHSVLCDPLMPSDLARDFGTSGTLKEWVENTKRIYNRPGAEAWQFGLCHSMGSALVRLMGSSNFHGIPLAYTGYGGTGKSTAAKIACGFYGNPDIMRIQSTEEGATINALIKTIYLTGSVPVVLDEFTGRPPKEMEAIAYAAGNGKEKKRLGSGGGFTSEGAEWFKSGFITSNDSVITTLSTIGGHKQDATQLRVFEVPLPENYIADVFPDLTKSFIEHHMDNVYGVACRPFIKAIIRNNAAVVEMIQKIRDELNPQSDEETKERFQRDAVVVAYAAAKIAKKIGLISFDIEHVKKWALQQILLMRDSRKEANTDISEHLAGYIATLPGRLIVTRHYGDARGRKKEMPLEPLRAVAVGRVGIEDKKVYVTVKSVNEFCQDHSVAPKDLREEMDRAGYLVHPASGNVSQKVYLGAGSTVPSGQSRCYELNYRKLFDGKSIAIVEDEDGNIRAEAV